MALPDTYVSALLLAIVSMICWGSWANSYKLTGKWRFELFYWDYSIGVLVAVLIAAFTFGSLGADGFSFTDDLLLVAGKRNIAYGFGAGVVFNLSNMLLVAAIAVGGMALAFPVGVGLAFLIGVIWNYLIKPSGNPGLLFTGVGLMAAAIVLSALAYSIFGAAKAKELIQAGKTASTAKPRTSWKGIVLSIAAGVLMGSFYPLVEMGKEGATGLGPYAIGFVFAVGIFFSTFPFNLFFMNLPVEGQPLEILDYFKGTARQHLLGILGGTVWAAGTITSFVVSSATKPAAGRAMDAAPVPLLGPAISYGLGQGAALISALWGLLVWKEFKGADLRVRVLLTLMVLFFAAGLGLISVAAL
jgi:glucose uptake protein